MLVPRSYIEESVQIALKEDIGLGDVTADLIPQTALTDAVVICREGAVICGLDWFEEVFDQLDTRIEIEWEVRDGEWVRPGRKLCALNGPARALLSGERTALNFLQTLSGTATLARRYADEVAGTGARVLDTRKTIPGLRLAQKYAVYCGGGENHRIGLYDAILIKENHIIATGGIEPAVDYARFNYPDLLLEVEVENMDELQIALDCGVRRILLDNFSLDQLRQAVAINQNRAKLEASGNVDLGNIRQIAETGVDYISTGALTKNVTAIDLSMRFGGLIKKNPG